MKRRTETFTLPEHYACYLMYGDFSGLADNEIQRIDAFCTKHKLGHCIEVGEAHDETHNDLDGYLYSVACDYTFEVID